MGEKIFERETSTQESWLMMTDDGTLTYHTSPSGWALSRKGPRHGARVPSVDEAKARWPQYASEIDAALAKVKGGSDPT